MTFLDLPVRLTTVAYMEPCFVWLGYWGSAFIRAYLALTTEDVRRDVR